MARTSTKTLLTTTLRLNVPTFEALERVRSRIRTRHQRNPARSEILRGIVAGVLASKLSFDDCLDTADFRNAVTTALKKGKA